MSRRLFSGAVVIAIAMSSLACGDEAVNVLSTRDGGSGTKDADASVEPALPDVTSDGTLSPDVNGDGAKADTSLSDVTGDARLDVSTTDGRPSDVTSDRASTPDMTSDSPPSDVMGDGAMSGCLAVGSSCSFAGACCSLSCPQNTSRVCASGPVCNAAGEVCDSNGDCCANRCQGAFCLAVPVGACLPAGETCTADSDCCGSRCAMNGGVLRCALLAGCRVRGEMCVTNEDCCSRRCESELGGPQTCVVAPIDDAGSDSANVDGPVKD